MTSFLKIDKVRENLDICFVAKKLYLSFTFATRIGIKTILLKENGEPLKKHHLPEVELDSYPKL